MNYAVRLPVFEGPLDLLLHLVEANRVDVYDIPVAQIAEQYLGYLAALSAIDVDAAAEFVVMAATLLEIKARMLLPRSPAPTGSPEGPDPRRELADRLVVYRKFKRAAAYLEELMLRQGRCYLRGGKVPAGEAVAGEISVGQLLEILRTLLKARVPVAEVARRRVSVGQKMREIMWRLRRNPAGLRFASLLPPGAGRELVVVTFLALLELLRQRRVVVRQEEIFGEIFVFPAGRGMPGARGPRVDAAASV